MPSASAAPLLAGGLVDRIAFGSCFAPQLEEDHVWDAILGTDPDLVLLLGDNVYQSEEKGEPELLELRTAYGQLADVASFARVRAAVPVLTTWDDHDYGLNDSGADFVAREESERLFEYVWDVADDDPRRDRPGVYGAWTFGPPGRRVQVVLLDTRFFRSPLLPTDDPEVRGKERYMADLDPSKTMLGAGQWSWLAERLRDPADVRVIVSSVQVIAMGHGFEGWFSLPRERQRLWDLIRETRASGVVLLSGDRHMAGYYLSAPGGAPYRIPELTSSSLNLPITGDEARASFADEPGPHRIGDLYLEPNFGTLEIDWDARTVALVVRDAGGGEVRREVWPIDELASEG